MLSTRMLLRELNDKGYPITHRRILDWIAEGLLPHPTRHGLGRGRGVVFVWEDGERVLRQAVRVAQALAWNRRLSNVIVPLWVMGYDMPLDKVRATLLKWYDVEKTLSAIREKYGQPGDEVADAISRKAVRSQKAGQFSWLKGLDAEEKKDAAEALLGVFYVPKYRPNTVILKNIARATGLAPNAFEPFKHLFSYRSPHAPADALKRAGDADLLWARDVLHQGVRLARVANPDNWAYLESLFAQDPDLLFNLAANAGTRAIPILVKLRLDGHAALIEELLTDARERAVHQNEALEQSTPNRSEV